MMEILKGIFIWVPYQAPMLNSVGVVWVLWYNRTDCCQDRLSDFTIRYSEDPINEKGDGFVLKESTQHPRIFEKFSPTNNKGKVNARYIPNGIFTWFRSRAACQGL
ncbi:MAG: hypothetical protein IPI60_04690 [Saprospiraceae bacterium]|nr:hypothetical protein [Saprospiraceae bacterium]